MKHTITETKIRSIVRKELQSYLIQEGLWDTIKGAVQNLPVAKQLSTLSNLGIDSDTLKSLAKTKPQDLAAKAKDAVDTATNTQEYREINTILSGINIGSTQLSQAYNLVYSKSKKDKNVYTFAQTPKGERETIINGYMNLYTTNFKDPFLTKLIEYFNSITTAQKNTIKSPMQERKINEGIDEKDGLIGVIGKMYTETNTKLDELKPKQKTYGNLLNQNLLSIHMFILQVLNELVTNPLQHQPTKIVESIKNLFATMTRHLGVLRASQPEPTPSAEAPAAATAAETAEPTT